MMIINHVSITQKSAQPQEIIQVKCVVVKISRIPVNFSGIFKIIFLSLLNLQLAALAIAV